MPRRGAALGRSVVVKTVNGTQVYQKWPRPRGAAKSPAQLEAQQAFQYAMAAIKNFDTYQQWLAFEVAADLPVMPRDLLAWQYFNRAYWYRLPDGRKVFSVPSMQDVSLLMDTLGQTPGQLLMRGPTFWAGLNPGAHGTVLKINVSGVPEWQADAPVTPPAEQFMSAGPIDPTVNSANAGASAFTARAIIPNNNILVTGAKLFIRSTTVTRNLYAGIYAEGPSGHHLSGGALVAHANSAALAVGLNTLPFTAPVTLTAGQVYWLGFGGDGAGTFTLAPLPWSQPAEFFSLAGTVLPATAPTATAGSGNLVSNWAY